MINSIKSIPFTAKKFQQLADELSKLDKEQIAIIVRLQTAREMGDLSENGAYKYAKLELGNTRRRISQLKYLINNGFIPEIKSKKTIEFGCTVTLMCKEKAHTYLIVSEYESNPKENKLSLTSPLGKALMGKMAGDSVEIEAPIGKISYFISKINY